MIYFSIYNQTTGEILNSGYVPTQDMYDLQPVEDGFVKVPVESNWLLQYFENGTPVDIPSKPDSECHFDFVTKQWVLNYDAQAAVVKGRRNVLLIATDWTQLPDAPITNKDAWAQYRQALRDITTQSGYPVNVVWPTSPQ
jgi:Phage tail assembly chaperone protein